MVRWRTHAMHHGAQEKGRFEVFKDYRIRVGEITADTDPPKGQTYQAAAIDATDVGEAKTVTLTESKSLPDKVNAPGAHDAELFESIYTPGKLLLLVSWRDAAAADAWKPPPAGRHRAVRVIREYSMRDRREAPQFYPDVTQRRRTG